MEGRSGPQVSGAWRFPWLYVLAGTVALTIGLLLVSGAPLAVKQAVSAVGLVGGALLAAASCFDRFGRSAGRRRRAWLLFALCALLAAASNFQL